MIDRYEQWVVGLGTRPTALVLAVVFTLLAAVTAPTAIRAPRSIIAFFWFALANMVTWHLIWWINPRLSAQWQLHSRVLMIHILTVSGAALIVTLIGKYVFGTEDLPSHRAAQTSKHDREDAERQAVIQAAALIEVEAHEEVFHNGDAEHPDGHSHDSGLILPPQRPE